MADSIYLRLANPAETLEDDEGKMPEEYNDFFIMREMGWDYWTFQNQPNFFIDLVRAFILAENKANATIKGRNKE